MDVFCEISFGVNLGSMKTAQQHEFARAFDTVQKLSNDRAESPFWLFNKYFLWWAIPSERAIHAGVKTMDEFAMGIISSKRRKAEGGVKGQDLGPDLLSRFLEKAEKANSKDATVPATLTDRELRDIVLNFIIAGRDTTACALSWAMYELTKVPKVIVRILEEARTKDVLAQEGAAPRSPLEVSYDDVLSLKYLHAVVSETLRLHPSVPKDLKFAVKQDTLPDGTVVPKGAAVMYVPYAMGRDPKLWKNPLTFDPERWLEGGDSYMEPSAYVFPTFNAGPRLCLGKPLAYMEIKLLLLLLLDRYTFECAKDYGGKEPAYVNTLVAPVKGGLPMRVTKKAH